MTKRLDPPPTLKEAVETCRKYLGCGDNSCLFVKPTGVGTNGGCRCRDRPYFAGSLSQLFKAAVAEVEKP